MEHKPIKLILSDIDGTIMPFGKQTVSDKTIEAFHACMDAGITCGVASGRIQPWLKGFFKGHEECVATGLTINGMEVYLNGELLIRKEHSRETVERLRRYVHETPGSGIFAYGENEMFIVELDRSNLSEGIQHELNSYEVVEGIPEDMPVTKLNMSCPPEDTATFIEEAKRRVSECDYLVVAPGAVNVAPAGWNKASGIDLLCETLGIGIDEVCVFGDAHNDLAMIEHVPCSVAVANAIPLIAEAATYHIGECEDDAVADAMYALAAGQWPFVD